MTRILHLGDLRINSKTQDHQWCRDLEKNSFDYITVCGDITFDGSSDSFSAAEYTLVALARRYLINEPTVPVIDRINRVIFAPGFTDLVDGGKRFNEFVANFRHHVFGDKKACLENQYLEIRELRDLTLITINRRIDNQSDNIDLLNIIESTQPHPFSLYTPTLLISCSPLSLDDDYCDKSNIRSISEVFGVDMHLAGYAPVLCFTGNPFTFKALHLTTGPRKEDYFNPTRANIIELSARKANGNTALLKIQTMEYQTQGRKWNRETWVDGHLDKMLEHDKWFKSQPIDILSEFILKIIDDRLTRLVLLTEFVEPELQRYLDSKQMEIENTNGTIAIKIITEKIEINLDKTSIEEESMRDADGSGVPANVVPVKECFIRIREKLAEILGSEKKTDKFRVIVNIIDLALPVLNVACSNTWWQNINLELSYLLENNSVSSLYIVCFCAQKYPITDPRLNWTVRYGFGSETDQFSNWLAARQRDVPFDFMTITQLTGTHLSIASPLIRELTKTFKTWPGARSISQESMSELLENALLSVDSDVFSKFNTIIEKFTDGVKLLNYLSVLTKKNFSSKDIIFTLDELSNEKNVLDPLMKEFIRLKIIEKVAEKKYRLLVRAPFYFSPIPFRVFISYRLQDESFVKNFINLIEETLRNLGRRIDYYMFNESNESSSSFAKIIDGQIKYCNNLLCFVKDIDDIENGFIKNEIDYFHQCHSAHISKKKAVCIPIYLKEPFNYFLFTGSRIVASRLYALEMSPEEFTTTAKPLIENVVRWLREPLLDS